MIDPHLQDLLSVLFTAVLTKTVTYVHIHRVRIKIGPPKEIATMQQKLFCQICLKI